MIYMELYFLTNQPLLLGELRSTKIMWPPTEGTVQKLNAFVCFAYREDAENAIEALDKMDPFGTGHVLKLGWAQPMMSKENTTSVTKTYDSENEEELAWHRPADSHRRRGELNHEEQNQFDRMFRTHLSASRSSICKAMAFCFENSTAAHHIFSLWRPILLTVSAFDSVDTLTARLYLLSDVLYNSQQPGIRNAFLYRDFVEEISRGFFGTIGTHARNAYGRIKQDKLTSAVKMTLGAWSVWGVYDPSFLHEVQCAYDGVETVKSPGTKVSTSILQFEAQKDEVVREDKGQHSTSGSLDDIDGVSLEDGDLDGISLDSGSDKYGNEILES